MTAMQINKTQFEQWMAEGKTVVVDYWAPWCGYCRRIGPAYDKIAEEPQLTEAQGVEVIPTLVLYKNGQAVQRVVAPKTKAAIDEFLQQGLTQ